MRKSRFAAGLSWRLILLPVAGIAIFSQIALVGTATVAAATTAVKPNIAVANVVPKSVNELDCNGWSRSYQTVRKLAGDLCTDPIKVVKGSGKRFYDNGWYVGHDEPSIKFISSAPGSGNDMTYLMRVPVDPSSSPTPSGSVTNYGELSIAPWFGLPICDPYSYPQNPCTPDSDSNKGTISDPADAGSAFLEVQLYPPGYTPFVDSESCSRTQWCAALTIDSLECTFGFATCNDNCIEPTNFAFLQTNGVPTGPPGPQLADVSSYLPNQNTLLINQGDVLAVSITDPAAGLTATIRDLTTHQTGYMTASAANGFMDTSIKTCDGRPFTFHAEYNTAQTQNRVPWAALEGGVLMEEEIGHSEACSSLTNRDPYSVSYPNGQSYSDPDTYDTCVGGSEGPGQVGEGPCNPRTAICKNAETQGPNGPQACPTDNADSGVLCEFADGYCFPKGTRMVTIDGVRTPETSASDECFADRYQNGDLDFDGISYQSYAWPNDGPNHPSVIQYLGPFDGQGMPYPQVQFETDINGSAYLCNTTTGTGCVVPPTDANFYPFYSLSRSFNGLGIPFLTCNWNFGNSLPQTVENFGGDAEYGSPDLSWYGGTSISAPMPNPEFSGRCGWPFFRSAT
jgi:hypothetical protein